jgi:hypothetical protein
VLVRVALIDRDRTDTTRHGLQVVGTRWCVTGALTDGGRIGSVERYRRLRRLEPDCELIRRRAAGETLRLLARDYRVAHTTLSRYFTRPDVAKQLNQAGRAGSPSSRHPACRADARRPGAPRRRPARLDAHPPGPELAASRRPARGRFRIATATARRPPVIACRQTSASKV